MSEMIQLTLPITGMTCANCVATIERNLYKLDGVKSAVVNLSSERANVKYDKQKLHVTDIIAQVQRAGYGVATAQADLTIQGLVNDHVATSLEESLTKLDGILSVKVSASDQNVHVE